MSRRILCTIGTAFAPEAKTVLESLGKVDYATPTQRKLRKLIVKYDIVVTQLGLRFDGAVLEHASRLRVIATTTTGTDHIDLRAAQKRGVTVVSLKEAKDLLEEIPSTAEHAWGLLLALVRNIAPAAEAVQSGAWDGKPFAGIELKGKTLGIIGVGRLGTMMARFGKAFGMEVIGTDIRKISTSVCKRVSLDALLKTTDVISLHVHLTPETEHMIGTKELRKMKPAAVLINTSRGNIVDERAVISALKTKKISGYATDVLAGETRFSGDCSRDPLVRYAKTHGNVLITPHIGGRTNDARRKTDKYIAEQVRTMLS